MEQLVQLVKQDEVIMAFIPDVALDKKRLSRKFIVTVAATVKPDYI